MNQPVEPLSAEERLRDAISGERADWHEVEVDPRDIAAVLARVAAPSDPVPLHLEATLPRHAFNLRNEADFAWLADYFSGYHGVPGLRARVAAPSDGLRALDDLYERMDAYREAQAAKGRPVRPAWFLAFVETVVEVRAALATTGQREGECGAPAVGGPCVLARGHNMGSADVPSNHAAQPEDTRTADPGGLRDVADPATVLTEMLAEPYQDYNVALTPASHADPGGLDPQRLAEAMRAADGVAWPKRWHDGHNFDWVARQVAAKYLALTPEATAPEDGS